MGRLDVVMPQVPRVAEVLDVVYRVDLPVEAWLRSLRLIPVIAHLASIAVVFRWTAHHRWELNARNGDPITNDIMDRTRASWSPSPSGPAPVHVLSGSQSETMRMFPLPEPYRHPYAAFGVNDVWALFARPTSQEIIACSFATRKRVHTPAPAKRFWDKVAIHLGAAARLRNHLDAQREAILTPDGKLLHAEGIAKDPTYRASLRRAARAIDRARTDKNDPWKAIESWNAMVEGRWTLVDEFESDGRHFMVARVNELKAPSRAHLSPREQHITELAAMGRSNKQIAYELGLEPPTVAGYLKRARSKLGLRRAQLLA